MRPGLDQGQRLEHLVERAEAAGEDRDRLGAHQEVHLADGEVVEVEAELRRDVEVRHLLVRQHDVEADRDAADVERAARCPPPSRPGRRRCRSRPRGCRWRARAGCRAGRTRAPRRSSATARPASAVAGEVAVRGVGDAGAAEHHHGRADAALGQRHLGLQQFELQPDRAQLVAGQELGVGEGEPVGRATASAACRARGSRTSRSSRASGKRRWFSLSLAICALSAGIGADCHRRVTQL